MKTLFIDRKHAELEIDRGRLVIRTGAQRPHTSIPTQQVDMLVISADIHFSSSLLHQLTQANITAVFLNPRDASASTLTNGMMHNCAERRLWQYGAIANPASRLALAKALMQQKLRSQQGMLLRALRTRPDHRHTLLTAAQRIAQVTAKTQTADSIATLRGLEGAAAAAYFEAYQTLFAPSLGFHNRNRRPPQDPVNVVLSLTYSLLHAEAVRTLFATGFDPLLGIYHDTTYSRESLACDLVELFRSHAERWIWRLFAEEVLCIDHFSFSSNDHERPCILGKRGRERYYTHYSGIACAWRRLMRRTSRHWLAKLRAEVPLHNRLQPQGNTP